MTDSSSDMSDRRGDEVETAETTAAADLPRELSATDEIVTTSAAPITERDLPSRTPVIPGHVSIAPRVLQKVGSAVVADSLAVDRHDVRVDAHDDQGRLALSVSTPVAIPVLSADVVAPAGGVLATIRSLQETVTTQILTITGRAVSRVDVTVTSGRVETIEKKRRVR